MAKPWKTPLRLYLTGRLAAELGVTPSPDTEAIEHALRAAPPRESG